MTGARERRSKWPTYEYVAVRGRCCTHTTTNSEREPRGRAARHTERESAVDSDAVGQMFSCRTDGCARCVPVTSKLTVNRARSRSAKREREIAAPLRAALFPFFDEKNAERPFRKSFPKHYSETLFRNTILKHLSETPFVALNSSSCCRTFLSARAPHRLYLNILQRITPFATTHQAKKDAGSSGNA